MIHSGYLIALLVLAVASTTQAAVVVTAFNNSVWPRTDASIGVAGYVIEDFENTTLAPGLQVKVESPSLGSYGPVTTLPFTFDATQDLVGGVFNSTLMWDGTHGLLNRTTVPITTYNNDGGWSDVSFLFPGGVTSLGFSYGQADANIVISLDLGSGFSFFQNSSTFLPGGSGRNGYLRFDAGPGEIIYGIKLDNQAGNLDGIVYDHLAFQPVASTSTSVPDAASSAALLGIGLLVLAEFRRRIGVRRGAMEIGL